MAHYAILPIYEPEQDPPSYEEINYKGHQVLACKTEMGYVLERVYSTDPKDFMNPDLLPGCILENSSINKIIQ